MTSHTGERLKLFHRQKELAQELAERKLRHYVSQAWPTIEPKTPFNSSWHIDCICEHLEYVKDLHIRNLAIYIPPRHCKSTLVSVMFPSWVWGPQDQPGEDFLCASYNPSLSTRDSVKRRRIMESPWYRDNWGGRFNFTPDQNEKTKYENTEGGVMQSTSTGGSGTGLGGDYLIIDDPHKVSDVSSDTKRKKVLDWYDNEFSNRVNDPERTRKILIMQRAHENDLGGHLAEKGNFHELVLPFEYDKKIYSYYKNKAPLVDKWEPRKEEGEILWPSRFRTKEAVATLTQDMSKTGKAAQLQQRPTARDGDLLKREYFKRRWHELPPRFDDILTTWDLTFGSEEVSGAYNVGYCIGRLGPDYYVIDEIRFKGGIVPQLKQLPNLKRRNPLSREILIEKAANGKASADLLKRKVSGVILVVPVGSKEQRAEAVEYLFEAHNVIFPADGVTEWAEDAVEELISFGPKAKYKDRVDSLVHGLERMSAGFTDDLDDLDFSGLSKQSDYL